MITRLAISAVGWVVAHLPGFVVAAIRKLVGRFFFLAFRKRRAILISNFEKAFPEKSRMECKSLAAESAQRMIELGLLSVTLPFWGEEKIRRSFKADDSLSDFLDQTDGRPAIVLLPHFSQMEAMTALPLVNERLRQREIGVIYRPFKNPDLEQWIRKTRSRFGIDLIPRGTKGLLKAKDILKRNGIVVMLFDQNARNSGVLTDFLGRIASTTNLPNLLYKHFRCPVYMLYPRRVGLFQAICNFEKLKLTHDENPDNTDGITTAMNRWLEQKLRQDRQTCCDWLWAHNRWHVCDNPDDWLALSKFRSLIDKSRLHKTFRVFIRIPNWLGDIVMSVPFIRAIRKARPDAEITLMMRPHYIDFAKLVMQKYLHCADNLVPIEPLRKDTFFTFFQQLWQYRKAHPDVLIRILSGGCFELVRRLLRPRLHLYFSISQNFFKRAPDDSYEIDNSSRFFQKRGCSGHCPLPNIHQIDDLHNFLLDMGYSGEEDLSPIQTGVEKQNRIGLICGSANTPAKRWPVHHWIELIKQLLPLVDADFVLFGNKNDQAVTRAIKEAFPEQSRVINRAGATNLCEFFYELGACRCVIGNDTDGVHLSHLQGVPTITLFGPTNPNKTYPKFDAPGCALVAPDYNDFSSLKPQVVVDQVKQWLNDKII